MIYVTRQEEFLATEIYIRYQNWAQIKMCSDFQMRYSNMNIYTYLFEETAKLLYAIEHNLLPIPQ